MSAQYFMTEAFSSEALNAVAKKMLQDGWKLFGGPIVVSSRSYSGGHIRYYHQTFVKYCDGLVIGT